ncbi:MAG: thioredoxin domain-containing protein [Pirellulales bacterium]|nr:thioredoxin domain-containing protein [Pirellulales bacterium]
MQKYTNKLANEKNPYLLQHAHNPVDWYPWGEEAFAKAREENKPIFLSIGYSTCHWCHVMARESFESTAIAEVLNRYFVSVKVDREERPDVDRVYMTFIQATTGGGGWPMSVWLTPDLKPFFGGTYYPPEERWGRIGFKNLLLKIADAWRTDHAGIIASSADMLERLRQATTTKTTDAVQLERTLPDRAYQQLKESYDPVQGGFGDAPKFPRPSAPDFLLRYYARTGTRDALEMVLFTLRKMADGGMHDHLGGGFHRYAVDERWHVPHFEKMLYDQAQLANSYLDAYQLTHEAFYAEVARDILHYVRRDMTGTQGQFYSAEDADSEVPGRPGKHAEGAFYVWEHDEIDSILGHRHAAIFNCRYGVEKNGNVLNDPHGEFHNRNVLIVSRPVEELAKQFGLSEAEIEKTLSASRALLREKRDLRPRPHLDDKTITAWNGLMISAYARAYQILGDEDCLMTATAATVFVRENLYTPTNGILLRRYFDGEAAIEGYADDYALMIHGLLDLYEASFDGAHLKWAIGLQKMQDRLFLDTREGGYFGTSGNDKTILMRIQEDYDGAEPSANSVSLQNLLRLAQMTGNQEFRAQAEQIIAAFSPKLEQAPHAMPRMISAFDFHFDTPRQIIIAGKSGAADTRELIRTLHELFIPYKTVMLADEATIRRKLETHFNFIASIEPVDGKATAYVCENGSCKLPVTDPRDLRAYLSHGYYGAHEIMERKEE